MKKLLLHTCCAPCAAYVHRLLEVSFDVTCFFYNPNIQPEEEYNFRQLEMDKLAKTQGWNVVFNEYDPKHWNLEIKGFEDEPERGKRCSICFQMRLKRTFEHAQKNGFDIVASTLSISPYKNTAEINREGQVLQKDLGIEFLAENFKKQDGYIQAKNLAHSLNIKHQDYCGCIFSKQEKIRRQQNKHSDNG